MLFFFFLHFFVFPPTATELKQPKTAEDLVAAVTSRDPTFHSPCFDTHHVKTSPSSQMCNRPIKLTRSDCVISRAQPMSGCRFLTRSPSLSLALSLSSPSPSLSPAPSQASGGEAAAAALSAGGPISLIDLHCGGFHTGGLE